ncbi:MAG: GrpB family protein [Patescibacteria group bacterium]
MSNLRDLTSLKEKYRFEEYDDNYPELYDSEKDRIRKALVGIEIKIHHFGSTSIKNVGGKGIIDIFIECSQSDIQEVSKILVPKLGYEFRASGGNTNRLFHQIEIEGRRYHVHLTDFDNDEVIRSLAFRDFLNKRPNLAKEYSDTKRLASVRAIKMNTRKEMKQVYMATKKSVINKITRMMAKSD